VPRFDLNLSHTGLDRFSNIEEYLAYYASFVPFGGQSGASSSHTGDTNETIFATIAIPANCLGANGRIHVFSEWARNGSGTSSVTPNIRFGLAGSGVTGTSFNSNPITTANQSGNAFTRILNANAAGTQRVATTSMFVAYGAQATTTTTASIDTTQATEINLTGTLVNAADTITLLGYQVIVYPTP
jgi:hypothetical protein